MTTTPTRRAKIKAKSPEEFERWRRLAEKRSKKVINPSTTKGAEK